MAQSNFVDNILTGDAAPLQGEVIFNSDLVIDMAASPQFDYMYVSPSEISIGAGYSIKLEGEKKNLYKDGIMCEPSTTPESVIYDITQYRGDTRTSQIGTLVSENYGLFMSPDKSFQFYKRLSLPDNDEDNGEGTATGNSSQPAKRYGYRCQNRRYGAPKSCGNNVKSGNPINNARIDKGCN
ncbi:hypothetical protein DV736_g6371, partial [Chaetothyriales sp. CBS 134916]